ncbi:O-antigen ligase family protein [Capnocytophaga canis]|uniref:O-antigen ligase family protein n=1 Tax=Capnocytophaga canis TaxID=1848903 RepID=UPI0015621829|nr:O-antigen ligase family protein [Capnocytophaga canis]
MKTKKRNKTTAISGSFSSHKKGNATLNLLISILLIAYGYVTVLTPNWMAFDSNAPKFYTFAILNLVVAILVFSIKDFREKNKVLFGFFTNKIGIAYTTIIFFALLSFAKVINVEEAVLHFFKVFTAFSAAWMVSALVIYNPKSITVLAVSMTALLLYDSLETFRGVSKIIKGTGSDIDIKSSYSNKNILASAMFIKIPFAIWLFFFKKDKLRIIGGIGTLVGTLAIFFMSTRAFYLATFIIMFVLIGYGILNYFILKNKKTAVSVGGHMLFVLIAFGIFSFVQGVMYPKAIKESTSFTARLATIADQENTSNNLRKTAWTTTLTEMIPNDPLLGVGIGNWKVRYLEYENSYSPHYIYMYKAHNDFLELTSEAGIFAGLAFLSIFLLIAYYFLRATYKNKNPELEKWLFLPLFGLFAYSFDAFFNFPQDRPEIQSLFAIYVGLAVGLLVVHLSKNNQIEENVITEENTDKKSVKANSGAFIGMIAIVTIVVNLANVVVQKMYFDSSKIQRMVKEEQQGVRKTKSTSDFLIQNYPKIPNLTAVAEPVDVEKARYLIDEKKFDEARKVLQSIEYNPWDGRADYFTAVSYFMEENKKYDSIYKYAIWAKVAKPNFFGNVNLATYGLNGMGRENESIELWKDFLELSPPDTTSTKKPKKWKKILKERFHVDVDKDGRNAKRQEASAWNALAYLLEKNGMVEEAKAVLDTAIKYVPNDKTVVDNQMKITSRLQMEQYLPIYGKALQLQQQRDYVEAVKLLSQFLEKVPAHVDALGQRAICYYNLQQYQNAIKDIVRMEELGATPSPAMDNYYASCYYMIGDRAKAKTLFERAVQKGNADAVNNLNKLKF